VTGNRVVVVVVVVVVDPQIHTFLPSKHWFGPVVVVGHAGLPAAPAPPGTHSVRTHSPATIGQYEGGTHPQGAIVVVGAGVVCDGFTVVVVDSGRNAPDAASLQELQSGPATQVVS